MASWTGHAKGQPPLPVSTFPGPIPRKLRGQLSLLPEARKLNEINPKSQELSNA